MKANESPVFMELSEQETGTWTHMWAFHSGIHSRLDSRLKQEAGVSHVEYLVLYNLARAGERRLRMSDLAQACHMTLSHFSRVITRLELQGMVARMPDSVDGRSTLAEITEQGSALLALASPGFVSEVRSMVFDHLEPEESVALGNAMRKLATAAVEHRS
ncbi:MarR family winged helix-turn-helix transcriptional regulator [Corynebacterium atrinae]|uniref:MarR family winged helix-turn-helix transcriptional regulator n=1 Tax=Corynebacterium atrinae TaxID=1336740 RepID=UPI0025B5B323|nr:MarR family transcriptional regulator [Corynebacterium atrinae]